MGGWPTRDVVQFFFYFFADLQCYILTFVLCFSKRKKTCGHACMIYNILLLITALARRAGHTLQRIDRSPSPGRSAPPMPSTAPTPPQLASRRRRQHAGHRADTARPALHRRRDHAARLAVRPCPRSRSICFRHLYSYACIYTSRSTVALVRPCVSMYTAEHRRPRSP